MTDHLRYLDRTLMRLAMDYKLCLTEKDYQVQAKALGLPDGNTPPFLLHPHSVATTHFVQLSNNGGVVALVCLDASDISFAQTVGYLTHEAMHIWQEHCTLIGETDPGKEVEAYGLQGIVENLAYEYMRQTGIVL